MKRSSTHRPVTAGILAALPAMLALALALPPTTAGAQPGPRTPAFEDLDSDGDGFVSEAELAEFRTQRMAQSAAEGRPMARADDVPAFADIDTDADGRLSPEEMDAFHRRQGQGAGRGGAMAGAGRGPGMQSGSGQPSTRGPGRGAGAGQAGARQVATFDEIDLDGDGCIDREELAEHHRVRGRDGS